MKINKIIIENFRSIQRIDLTLKNKSKFKAFVGVNNIGKSNILRAINLFFNGETDPGIIFNTESDICKNNSINRVKVHVEFEFDPKTDKSITAFIQKNTKFKDAFEKTGDRITIPITCQIF